MPKTKTHSTKSPKTSPFDPALLAPAAKARLVRIGRRYGSADTLRQADKTITAYSQNHAALQARGYGDEDDARLRAARSALEAAGATRDGARSGQKETDLAHHKALMSGKDALAHGRTILQNTGHALEDLGHEAEATAVKKTLRDTSSAGEDITVVNTFAGDVLARLEEPVVKAAAAARGGAEAAAALKKARAAMAPFVGKAARHGTPTETEAMDLCDGLIVRLARQARRSARLAARALGQEALAAAFALSELTPRAKKPRAKAPAPGAEAKPS